MAVFLFHVDKNWLPGGFIGVDIFLVISGFLVGSIVHKQVMEGRFQLRDFWARRIRRILPALFVMVLSTWILGYHFLLPPVFEELSQSAIFAAIGTSNIYFWKTTKYFGLDADSKPLLHTWSLGLEEQFYLFFPLLVLAVFALRSDRLLPLIILLAAISLAIGITGTNRGGGGAFFLLPARAWEFLIGFLIVLRPLPRGLSDKARSAIAVAGFAMITLSLALIDEHTPFPGVAALFPCLGAAMMIASGGRRSIADRALSLPPAVFIGRISYSVYLWHWPLIVLAKESLPVARFTPVEGTLVVMLGLGLGYLSWRYIEQPFRHVTLPRPATYAAAGGGAVLITLMVSTGIISGGLPKRFDQRVSEMSAFVTYEGRTSHPYGTCFTSHNMAVSTDLPCLRFNVTRPNVALVGDSHAEHLWFGLEAQLADINLIPVTVSGCPPKVVPDFNDTGRCTRLWRFVFEDYFRDRTPRLAIIASNWYDRDQKHARDLIRYFRDRSVPVLLVGPIVRYDIPLAKLVALTYDGHSKELAQQFVTSDSAALDRSFEALARSENVPYFSAYRALCPAHCTLVAANGAPLQFDRAHLTEEGSSFVADQLAPVTRSILTAN